MSFVELFDEFADGRLRPLGDDVARGSFTFWLGSGISRDRVPPVRDLILKIAEFLRAKVQAGENRFEASLNRLIELAGPSPEELRQIHLMSPVATWPTIDVFLKRLETQYAKILDIRVDGEERDYILWTAAELCSSYANSATPPDVTHLLLGMLVLEGVAPVLVTSNWDALIELAIANLSLRSADSTLGVRVASEDFRQPIKPGELLKIHGCAAYACLDETKYRPLLIGRESQITGWADDNRDTPMLMRLIELATTRKSLILGMSGQDSNIKHVFRAGSNRMPWQWPDDPAACMLATQDIEADHRVILEHVYRAAYAEGDGPDIEQAAVIGDFAGPVLAGLLAYIRTAKLRALIDDLLTVSCDPAELQELGHGVTIAIRSLIAAATPSLAETHRFVEYNCHIMSLFMQGVGATPPYRYIPIADVPMHMLGTDMVRAARYREMAGFIAIVGIGMRNGFWSVDLPEPRTESSPTLIMRSTGPSSRVFLVSSMDAGINLYKSGRVSDGEDDVVIVYGDAIPPTVPRSSTSAYGRDGKIGTRVVGLGRVLGEYNTASEMLKAFQSGAQL